MLEGAAVEGDVAVVYGGYLDGGGRSVLFEFLDVFSPVAFGSVQASGKCQESKGYLERRSMMVWTWYLFTSACLSSLEDSSGCLVSFMPV